MTRIAYRLPLTKDEIKALVFIGERYCWPEILFQSINDETDEVEFEEADMWQWTEDVEDDMVGGHSPFPMASPEFAQKLQAFKDQCV